uniref:SH3 domain-containing protein n=1 Tax=Amphiprion ocellaris TaxID=80972 RepID=A0AAQ5X4W1_AMPOC
MAPKRRGALQLVQREVDEINKQTDSLVKDVQNQVGSTEEAFQRCQELQMSSEETLKKLKELTKADELAPVGNYDQRKQEEERRLQNMLERLNSLSLELSPPGPSSAAGNVSKEDSEDGTDEDDDSDDDDDGDTDGNDGEDEKRAVKPSSQSDPRIYTVLSDFKGEQEGDLSVQRGEVLRIIRKTADGWWLVQDTKGSRGLVPRTYLKVQKLDEDDSDDDNEESEEEEEEVEELTEDRDKRRFSVRTCVCFTLWGCRMIPTPGVGVQVLSRHIRLCAFDGAQVLSNIHTVRAAYNSKSPKTWSFSPRMTGILPTLLDGECFLRCDSTDPNLGILFELGVTFIRNSTGERGDLSCGWAFLKLTDDAGKPLPNRTYELPVNGGTPYETDVAVEASATKGCGVFQQMLQARRQPKLIVKLKSTNSRTRTQLSLLPDTLLHSLSCVHLLALHRQLLADTLLMDRPTMQDADLICSPILSTFPVLLDQTDLLDALRSAWLEAETSMSRAQKRDLSYLKQEFIKVYMSSVYFLLHSPSLPRHRWGDPPSEEQRARVVYATLETLKNLQHSTGQSGRPEVFVEQTHSHLAFDISELSFDLLRVAR